MNWLKVVDSPMCMTGQYRWVESLDRLREELLLFSILVEKARIGSIEYCEAWAEVRVCVIFHFLFERSRQAEPNLVDFLQGGKSSGSLFLVAAYTLSLAKIEALYLILVALPWALELGGPYPAQDETLTMKTD